MSYHYTIIDLAPIVLGAVQICNKDSQAKELTIKLQNRKKKKRWIQTNSRVQGKKKKNNISEGRRFSTTASLAIVIFLAAKESLKVSREE